MGIGRLERWREGPVLLWSCWNVFQVSYQAIELQSPQTLTSYTCQTSAAAEIYARPHERQRLNVGVSPSNVPVGLVNACSKIPLCQTHVRTTTACARPCSWGLISVTSPGFWWLLLLISWWTRLNIILVLIQVKEMPECQNMYIKSFSRCLVAHQLCCTCQVYSEKSLLFAN